MSATKNQLGKQAKEVTEDLQAMGETVRDAAQKKLEQMGETASDYLDQGRDKVHDVACACKQFIGERPLSSILIAVSFGWLIGRFWKSR
jgi:ElaB/YqjD/DUF883 family membrane-anchored ribosome-binding protein